MSHRPKRSAARPPFVQSPSALAIVMAKAGAVADPSAIAAWIASAPETPAGSSWDHDVAHHPPAMAVAVACGRDPSGMAAAIRSAGGVDHRLMPLFAHNRDATVAVALAETAHGHHRSDSDGLSAAGVPLAWAAVASASPDAARMLLERMLATSGPERIDFGPMTAVVAAGMPVEVRRAGVAGAILRSLEDADPDAPEAATWMDIHAGRWRDILVGDPHVPDLWTVLDMPQAAATVHGEPPWDDAPTPDRGEALRRLAASPWREHILAIVSRPDNPRAMRDLAACAGGP